MVMSVGMFLAVLALLLTLISGIWNKLPLWVPVLLLCVAVMTSGIVVWHP